MDEPHSQTKKKKKIKKICGQGSEKRENAFTFDLRAAEERDTNCREEKERGDDWQEMPVAERAVGVLDHLIMDLDHQRMREFRHKKSS